MDTAETAPILFVNSQKFMSCFHKDLFYAFDRSGITDDLAFDGFVNKVIFDVNSVFRSKNHIRLGSLTGIEGRALLDNCQRRCQDLQGGTGGGYKCVICKIGDTPGNNVENIVYCRFTGNGFRAGNNVCGIGFLDFDIYGSRSIICVSCKKGRS